MELLANYLTGGQGKVGEIKGGFKSAMVLGHTAPAVFILGDERDPTPL